MLEKSEKYDDIINLPRHVSKKYPRMSLEARSAQFAPFAALTGYDEVINETARLTSERKEINEELKMILNDKLKIIQEKLDTKPEITFKYFIPDIKKDGGEYVTKKGNVIKIDKYKEIIILKDETEISISEIIEITGDIFKRIN